MKHSLSGRLLGILFAVVLTAWITTAYFSYRDARQKIGEVLDANLAHSAFLLQALLQRSNINDDPSAIGLAVGVGQLAFRAVDGTGKPVLRSSGFPDLPTAIDAEGYSDVSINGTHWRLYGARDPLNARLVQVAEPYETRAELAGSVVGHLLHPVWIALPLLVGLIWMSVKWGLAPLRSLARDVERRDPRKLQRLDEADAPREARPLIRALNALFARVTALQDRERRFAADAAHELRTPLAAIRTHAELARKGHNQSETQESIDKVLRGVDRTAHLVDQLLVLARLEPERALPFQTRVALGEIAVQAISDCTPMAAARNVDLGLVKTNATNTAIDGNVDLLAVMARNLIDNAVRYVGDGGTVDVSVTRAGSQVSFTVADNGPGLSTEERSRIFDRFYRKLGSGQEGSGLGLSIVARIAELHGAAITVDTGIAGRGLAVTVTFSEPAT